ncbi:hypothetical protein CAC42_7319 [Sphaceloma murrayae]|uniref:Uncharacterized protein n=1 Tax=Sphaceloma murrayae TaxID=2082308 RepID=A0A2K1QWP4_9PEZI|nr:hypothetical protein CAC42_7319 [Sphaceloma murrayae]
MDAKAYLRRHGWKGTGHSLHPHKTSSLKRPLLVSRKVDVLGVGINKNDSVSDQWWLRAFDSSLKNMGTGQTSVLANVREHGIKRGGLYGRFVKGEVVEGTIGRTEVGGVEAVDEGQKESSGAKSKAENLEEQEQTKKVKIGSKRKAEDLEEQGQTKKVKISKTERSETNPSSTEKKLSAKAEKHAREKASRVATREQEAALEVVLESSAAREEDGVQPDITALADAKQQRKMERRAKKAAERKAKKAEIAAIPNKYDALAALQLATTEPESLTMKKKHASKAEKHERKARARAIAEATTSGDTTGSKKLHALDTATELQTSSTPGEAGIHAELDPDEIEDILKKLSKIAPDKRNRYIKLATAKGQTLATYFIERQLKSKEAEQRASKHRRANEAAIDAPTAALLESIPTLTPTQVLERVPESLWEGQKTKDLSKALRKLRQARMRATRALRDGASGAANKKNFSRSSDKEGEVLTRDQRKIKQQEDLATEIMKWNRISQFGEERSASRDAGSKGVHGVKSSPPAPMYNGREPYPTIKLETKQGRFLAWEVKAARRAAKRLIRHEKQDRKRSGVK